MACIKINKYLSSQGVNNKVVDGKFVQSLWKWMCSFKKNLVDDINLTSVHHVKI